MVKGFFKILSVNSVDPSPTCDHLYFVKHVQSPWQLYKLKDNDVTNNTVRCTYSMAQRIVNNKWSQPGQKFARQSLLYADSFTKSK